MSLQLLFILSAFFAVYVLATCPECQNFLSNLRGDPEARRRPAGTE